MFLLQSHFKLHFNDIDAILQRRAKYEVDECSLFKKKKIFLESTALRSVLIVSQDLVPCEETQ